ncbi:MAG: hypothetical protein JXX14_21495, partial [Deltaproteobacteria bacterium]|nr:hypothetical protein [Deltaproteobacteria bacterium]
LDARIRGCRESAYSIHQSSHSQLDWESRLCIYWVPACAGTTDFAFHVAKTAFCDTLILGHDGCFLNGKIRVIAIFQAKDRTYV